MWCNYVLIFLYFEATHTPEENSVAPYTVYCVFLPTSAKLVSSFHKGNAIQIGFGGYISPTYLHIIGPQKSYFK